MLLIDHLGPGGAQRQMSFLAGLLKDRGQEVIVVVYHAHDFFAHVLAEAGIEVKKIKGKNAITRTISLKSFLKEWKPDAVVAYLDTPSLIAELASLPRKKFGLIVSERTGKIGPASLKDRLRLRLHRFADAVVTNSNKVKSFIIDTNSKLEQKIHVIHNGVNLDHYAEVRKVPNIVGEYFDIVVLARYRELKNPFNLLKAIHQLSSESDSKPVRLTWYGNNNFIDGKPSRYSTTYVELKEEVEKLGLESRFVMKLHTKDVVEVYQNANAICLGSFYEGFSNTLCEAISCGKPVLASNVCDNPILVEHEQNGFLFEPHSADSIATAFRRIASASPHELEVMGDHSFVLAEKLLSPERMVGAYLDVIDSVCN